MQVRILPPVPALRGHRADGFLLFFFAKSDPETSRTHEANSRRWCNSIGPHHLPLPWLIGITPLPLTGG